MTKKSAESVQGMCYSRKFAQFRSATSIYAHTPVQLKYGKIYFLISKKAFLYH